MTGGRALESVLDALHGMAAEALITELQMHMDALALATPAEPYEVPPQFLDKVLKFLAQNGINAAKAAPKVDALASKLADLDLDDEAVRLN